MARILYVVTAASDDPTRAALPFNFALGALEAGHRPEIFLTGEGVYLMRPEVAGSIVPAGEDLEPCHAQFISPKIFAEKVVAADRVVSL